MISNRAQTFFSKISISLILCSFIVISSLYTDATAAEYSIYGPRVFLRDTGTPVIEKDTIVAINPGSYKLKIHNGDDQYERVSSSVITLNGVEILSQNELNQRIGYIEKTVHLQQTNEFHVEVGGKPGGALIINFEGEDVVDIDDIAPSIISYVTPQANINNWHRTDVLVTFDCNDEQSGIASCTSPLAVVSDGAGQVVTGTAVDNAGNTADTIVSINLDKTPPVINITSPEINSLISQSNITITGQIYDGFDLQKVTVNDVDVSLQSANNLSYPVLLLEGLNNFVVVATDAAGNITTNVFDITYQPVQVNKPPVALSFDVITLQDSAADILLTANDEDGDALTYQIIKQPGHGQLIGTGSILSYQPDVAYFGLDSFEYLANDSVDDSNIATVNIDIQKQILPIVITPPVDIIVEATATLTSLDIGVAKVSGGDGSIVEVIADNYGPYPLGLTVVTWTAIDISGAQLSVHQDITIQDTTPPNITLIAPQSISFYCENEGFIDSGALAVDIVDGDLTKNIYSVAGEYVYSQGVGIDYFVTDLSGNQASIHRAVSTPCDYTFLRTGPFFTLPSIPNVKIINTVVNGDYINLIEATGELTSISNVEVPVAYDNSFNVLDASKSFYFPEAVSFVTQPISVPESLPIGNAVVVWTAYDSNGWQVQYFQNIHIADTTAPQITLNGESVIYLDVGTPYIELGASVLDIVDGDLSTSIITTGAVNTTAEGQYIVTYQVQDAYANQSQVSRTVNVVAVISNVDITAPVVTAPADITAEATAQLTALAIGTASAVDDVDGTVVATPNNLGPFSVGTHSVVWSAQDVAGNVASAIQNITVVDTTAPQIFINGLNFINLDVGANYTELGATAFDSVDGDLSAFITATGSVNMSVAGQYTVTYQVQDAHANQSLESRTVNVFSNVDSTAPVITVPADISSEATAPLTPIVIGTATAVDNIDGIVTTIPNTVGPFSVGTHNVVWSAQDAAGNVASAIQNITVVDTTAPQITLNGSSLLTLEINTPYTELGASAQDLVDGNLSTSIITTGTVNTAVAGQYTMTYQVQDLQANQSLISRVINVVDVASNVDITAPVITAPADITAEASAPLTPIVIGTATAVDNIDGMVTTIPNTVGPFSVGTHNIVWSAQDAAGNVGTVTQIITVVDTIAPQIIPNAVTVLIGGPSSQTINIDKNTPYTELGANAIDLVDGDVSANVIITGTVNTSTVGQYTITYQVQDTHANQSQVTLIVNVVSANSIVDTSPPVVTVPIFWIDVQATGYFTPVDLELADAWTEFPEVTAVDDVDGVVVATPSEIGPFPVGTTMVLWSAEDAAGNIGVTFQLVSVTDYTAPVLTIPADITIFSLTDVNLADIDIGTAQATDIFPVTISNNTLSTYPYSYPARINVFPKDTTTSVHWVAIDAYGNTAYAIQNISVSSSQPPIADAGVDRTVTLNAPITFDASNSFDPDGSIVSYKWEKDDVTIIVVNNIPTVVPTKILLSNDMVFTKSDLPLGVHFVTLTVTDNSGISNSVIITVNIIDHLPQPPIADAGSDKTANINTPIIFDASNSYDPDGNIVSYKWEKDGVVLSTGITFTKSDLPLGANSITLTVTDNSGLSSSATIIVTVTDQIIPDVTSLAPIAIADGDKTVIINTPITFDASSSYDPDGEIVSYIWKKDGVVFSSEMIFTKSDLPLGENIITLTVTDNSGVSGNTSLTITIVNDTSPALSQCNLAAIVDDRGFSDIYPNDNIAYSGSNYSDVVQIENAFNGARYQDKSISKYLKMPLQSVWDAMTAQQKGLYLVNSERLSRGIIPFEGTSQNIVNVAKTYADYMQVNNQIIGHYNDGRSPQQRLDDDPVILNNRDAEIKSENVYSVFATTLAGVGSSDERIVEAVYTFIYEDKYPYIGTSWGHRSAMLQPGLVENSGIQGEEGLIGFGVAQGAYNPNNDQYYPYGSIVVINFVDSSSLVEYSGIETVTTSETLQCNDGLNIELDQSTTPLLTLESLVIAETQIALVVGQSQYINVVGRFSDGTEQDITHLVDFVPDNFSVVSINAGQITGLVSGNVGISVTANGLSSNRLMVTVGVKTDTINLIGTDAEQYIPYIPENASTTLYNANTLTLVTGQVNDLFNVGLTGVEVSILNRPEYGTTLTDVYGKYVFAVPAGNHVVSMSAAGYLSVQRKISAASHSWAIVETVTLQDVDGKSSIIDLFSSTPQVHQSTPYTDLRGTRSTTLVFDGINTATVTSADGSQRSLNGFSVSASEFTTPETMPGNLPTTSAYTYCADISVAGVAENESVLFDKDVIMYVDNFLGFDIGEIVPIGYYDRLTGEWVGSKNGVVVKLLDSNNDGLIDGVDYTGDDVADDVDGDGSVTDETRGIENYPVGATYWRGAMNHFSVWDFNWSTIFGSDTEKPKQTTANTNEELTCGEDGAAQTKSSASYVNLKTSAHHEDLEIAGTNLTLHYNSQRTEGYQHAINVTVSGDVIPATLAEMLVKVEIAGVTLEQKFLPQANMEANFIWDGYNAVGEIERGEVKGVIKVGYAYPVNYGSNGNAATTALTLDQFEQAWAKTGPNVTTVEGRQDGILWTTQTLTLYNAPESEIASGWSLSNQHVLTPSDRIHTGTGEVIDIVSASNVFKTGVVDSFIAGDDGFYQKAGKAIDYDILAGDVLRDNVTELMWQYQNPQYFNSNAGASAYCASLNQATYFDWRLPTLKEDTYTRNKGSFSNEIAIYSRSAPFTWNTLTFNLPNGPQNVFPVYCVRGEILDDKYALGLERNIIDEVVVDKSNGLMWQDDSSVLTTQGDWAFAINHCENLDNAGYTDWRLPNINEFMYTLPNSVFSYQTVSPNPWYRTHPDANPYWSSTPNVLNISNAWAIESEGYNSSNYPQTDSNYVRCVRDDLSQARSHYRFNSAGKHLETIDQDTGNTLLTYDYDIDSKKLISVTDQFGNQINLIRSNGVLTAIESPDGLLTSLFVDSNNNLVKVSYEDGSAYQFTYQSSLMTLETDPNTNQFPHNYDLLGRLNSIEDPENGLLTLYNNHDSIPGTKVYGYSTAEGRLYETQRVVNNGLVTKTTRSEDGTVVTETISSDTLVTTTESGGVITVLTKVPDLKTKRPQLSKLRTTLPSGLSSTLDVSKAYANNGSDFSKLTTSTIFNTKTSSLFEDFKLGTKILNTAENRQITINYDPLTLLTRSIQTTGLFDTTYQYDSRGRLIQTSTGDRANINSYDAIGRGQLTASTNALGQTSNYEYDVLGRLIAQTSPDNRVVNYRYDANGNLTGVIPPGKPEHIIEYNSVNNESAYVPPGVAQTTTPYTQYVYNRDRDLTQIIRPDLQTIDFIYNDLTQVTQLNTPNGATDYTYDATTGNVTSITAPDGNTLSYAYDGSLNTQTTWAGEINASVVNIYNNDFVVSQREINGNYAVSFARDNDLLLTQAGALSLSRDIANGLITNTTIGNSTTATTYNNYGEVASYSANTSASTQYQVSYQYDLIGRISQQQETIEGVTTLYDYSYDLGGRLETISIDGNQVAIYTYDSNGNRTHVNGAALGQHDAQDRLTQYGNTQYQYSDNGELLQKTNTQTSESTGYYYDVLGNLRQVIQPNNTQIDYLIDGQSRRIGKKLNGSLVQGFIYKDQLNPIAELDGNNQVISRFIYASKSNVPDYMVKGATSYRIISNHLGSPRLVVNAQTGEIVQRMDYDTWGNIINDTNPGFQPFGFAGGIYDQQTKLTRFGARDYDAETARWTSKDPIRFAGGDTNLYTYVLNNPINFADPLGLYTAVIHVSGPIPHSAMYIGGDDRTPFLYDPAGSYQPSNGERRGSGDFFEGDAANISDYVNYHTGNGETVRIYPIPTTPDQEREIIERAINQGGASPGFCAGAVSGALGGACGVESSGWPSSLYDNTTNAQCK